MGRREELGRLDENDLFMELIRDVANELDINVLCHKILVNVGLLTHADRGSLFLAKGPLEDRYLVAKLFDVTQETELEEAVQRAKNEEIKIPFGVGIAGYVAQTKKIINIKDAYKVPPSIHEGARGDYSIVLTRIELSTVSDRFWRSIIIYDRRESIIRRNCNSLF